MFIPREPFYVEREHTERSTLELYVKFIEQSNQDLWSSQGVFKWCLHLPLTVVNVVIFQ